MNTWDGESAPFQTVTKPPILVPWWQKHPHEVGLNPRGCIPRVQAVSGSLVVLRDDVDMGIILTAVDQQGKRYMRDAVTRYAAEYAIPDIITIECQSVLVQLVIDGLKVSSA